MKRQERVDQDVKSALKSGDTLRRSVLSMLKAAILNEAIALRKKDKKLSEEEFAQVIRREIKKRNKAIEQMQSRPDLVEKEEQEIKILKEYESSSN